MLTTRRRVAARARSQSGVRRDAARAGHTQRHARAREHAARAHAHGAAQARGGTPAARAAGAARRARGGTARQGSRGRGHAARSLPMPARQARSRSLPMPAPCPCSCPCHAPLAHARPSPMPGSLPMPTPCPSVPLPMPTSHVADAASHGADPLVRRPSAPERAGKEPEHRARSAAPARTLVAARPLGRRAPGRPVRHRQRCVFGFLSLRGNVLAPRRCFVHQPRSDRARPRYHATDTNEALLVPTGGDAQGDAVTVRARVVDEASSQRRVRVAVGPDSAAPDTVAAPERPPSAVWTAGTDLNRSGVGMGQVTPAPWGWGPCGRLTCWCPRSALVDRRMAPVQRDLVQAQDALFDEMLFREVLFLSHAGRLPPTSRGHG